MLRKLATNQLLKRVLASTIDSVGFDVSSLGVVTLCCESSLPSSESLITCALVFVTMQSSLVWKQAPLTATQQTSTITSSIRPLTQLITLRSFAAAPAINDDADIHPSNLPPLPLSQHTEQGIYRDIEAPLYDSKRQQIGTYTLDGTIFNVPIRTDILHRVVKWQLARRQQGTHKTKTRSEVRGGGRKPWKQKGSGRARQGSIRAPQWRGGGVAHGPVPRSHAHDLPKRVRRLGLKCALSAKTWERRLLVVDSLRPEDHKTKTMDARVDELLKGAPRRSVLFVDSAKDGDDGGELLRSGSNNLAWVDVIPSDGLNVYSILQRDYLIATKNAVDLLVERLKRKIKPHSLTP